jgi:hypothetical protein
MVVLLGWQQAGQYVEEVLRIRAGLGQCSFDPAELLAAQFCRGQYHYRHPSMQTVDFLDQLKAAAVGQP